MKRCTCLLCEKPEREVIDANVGLCSTCLNRPAFKGGVTDALIYQEKAALRMQRLRSRRNNRLQMIAHPVKTMPLCPHCLSNESVEWVHSVGAYLCLSCYEGYLEYGNSFSGSFWYIQRRLNHTYGFSKKTKVYHYVIDNVVYTVLMRNRLTRIIDSSVLDSQSYVQLCEACKSNLVLDLAVRPFELTDGEFEDHLFCPECVNTTREIHEALYHQDDLPF